MSCPCDFHCKFFKGKLDDRQELLKGLLPLLVKQDWETHIWILRGKKYYVTYWLELVLCVKELHRIPE